MVLVSLHPANNQNHSGRYFPSSGFLGLTRVHVAGIVRTRVEDDKRLLGAYRVTISIKCYELRSRLTYSRCNTLVDVTEVLWSSPSPNDCADIGDMDLPFRISLPADVAGFSTLSFPDYRIFWRIEAAIEHPPQFGLGSRQSRSFELDLARYNPQQPFRPSTSLYAGLPQGYRPSPSSGKCDSFHYRLEQSDNPTGPGDELPLAVSFLFPTPANQLTSFSCHLERKLNLYEAAGSPTPSDFLPTPSSSSTLGCYQVSAASSSASLLSSYPSSQLTPKKRSDSPPATNVILPSKSITSQIASGSTSNFEPFSPTGVVGRVTLSLPAKPPPSQWPVGESLKTDLAEIKFELRFKVTVNTPSGLVEVALDPHPIRLCPISQEQRSMARDKIAKKKEKWRAKSAPSSRRSSPVAARSARPTEIVKTKSSPGTVRSRSPTRSSRAAARRASFSLSRSDKNRLDFSPPELDRTSTSGSSRAEPETPPILAPKISPNASLMDVSYFDGRGGTTPSSALTFASGSTSESTSTHETRLLHTTAIETPTIYASRSGSASTSALSSFPFYTSGSPKRAKSRPKEDIGNGWSASSKSSTLKRLPLLSTHSSTTARPKPTDVHSPLTPSPSAVQRRSSTNQLQLGITTPTNLKRMPSNAVRAWEEELERITTRSKSSSDTMQVFRQRTVSNASASPPSTQARTTAPETQQPERVSRGLRVRRSTVNALSALGIPVASSSPSGPPSSFRMGGLRSPKS